MTFTNPRIFWLALVLMPALIWFLIWAWRKRQYLMQQFVQSRLLAQLTVGVSPRRQMLRSGLLAGSVLLLLIALAGPRAGFDWEEATTRGLDIVVALDTSRSMLANDVVPNRLERAKLEALDLLKIARTDRLGLVAFSGTAFLQCPLTLDEDAFRQSVAAVDVGIIPQGGTAMAEAIRTAQGAFKDEKENYKVLILFTDGEDHEEGVEAVAREASQAGMRIFTIGVGTPEGELLKVQDGKGASSYLKDESGNVVKSRLNERLLQQVATAGNGFYLPLRGTKTMATLYEKGLAPLPKAESSSKLLKRFHERYAWPLGFAIAALIAEIFIPDRRKVRVSMAAVAEVTHPNLKGLVSIILAMLLPASAALASSSSASRAFQSGKFSEAAAEFERLAKERPEDARLRFNAGTAALEAGEFNRAATNLTASLSTEDISLQQRAYYNLGNALFKAGEEIQEMEKRAAAWQEAVQRFESAVKLDSKDTDARHNLDYVKARLAELKNQQQKNQDNSQDSKDDKDDKNQESDDKQQGQGNEQKNQQGGSDDKSQQQDKQNQQNQKQQPKDSQEDSKDKQGQDGSSNDDKNQKGDQKDSQNQNKEQNRDSKDSQQGQSSDKPGQKQDGTQSQEGSPSGQQQGVMTPQQAAKVLDSQRGEEKAMLFIPKNNKGNRNRSFKDW